MPTYDFACDACGAEVELFLHVSERERLRDVPLPCACGVTDLHQVFRSCNIVGDEIGRTEYLDPLTHRMTQSHGQVYDEGLGAWYGTKSERRRIMKEKGVREYGGADPHGLNDRDYRDFYRKTQEAQR